MSLVTNRDERVAPGSVLYGPDRTFTVVSSRPHQGKWVVQFEGVAGRDAADALRNTTLSAPPIDDPDEVWVHDLIGARVVELDGTERGTVESVLANPASDLLVLDTGALVPLTFLVEHHDGVARIDPPAGLFDL